MNNPYSSHGSEALDSDLRDSDSNDTVVQRGGNFQEPEQQTGSKLSVLGPSLTFKGEMVAGEDLLIQGRVEGSIKHTAQNLTIGPEGTVKANIRARAIVVRGTVRGDLYATEVVTVEPTAKVQGNIFAPKVGHHEGATFKGSIDMEMSEEHKTDSPPARKTASKPSSKRRAKDKRSLGGEDVEKLLE